MTKTTPAMYVPDIDKIPNRHWRETAPCPDDCLCHNITKEKIAKQVVQTRPNAVDNHGVYVLECKRRIVNRARNVARYELKNEEKGTMPVPRWVDDAAVSERLLYVGVSKRMTTRLWKHAKGTGAHFTRVFPPVRLLDIFWFPTLAESLKAEPQIAEQLRGRFPRAFVSQPG